MKVLGTDGGWWSIDAALKYGMLEFVWRARAVEMPETRETMEVRDACRRK